jgi:hypothetical protein
MSKFKKKVSFLNEKLIIDLFVFCRIDKISKSENQLASGKNLHEEQLQLLTTKPLLEKLLSELELLKNQLEDVVKEVILFLKFDLLSFFTSNI